MEKNKKESVHVTQESWEHSLWIYVQEGNTVLFNRLWNAHPDFAAHMIHEFDDILAQSDICVTKEEARASWERMKAQLREEYGEDFI